MSRLWEGPMEELSRLCAIQQKNIGTPIIVGKHNATEEDIVLAKFNHCCIPLNRCVGHTVSASRSVG